MTERTEPTARVTVAATAGLGNSDCPTRTAEPNGAIPIKEPPKLRAAAGVIVTATALVVVGGGVLLRVVDLLAHRRVDPTDGRAGGLINRRPSLSGDRSWR